MPPETPHHRAASAAATDEPHSNPIGRRRRQRSPAAGHQEKSSVHFEVSLAFAVIGPEDTITLPRTDGLRFSYSASELLCGFGSAYLLCSCPSGYRLRLFPARPSRHLKATRLTFKGEPLVLPLECWEEDLLRAGLVCNDVTPCSLVMELVAIGELGSTVFVMGNVHADAGTVSSVILSSNDGGKVWTEPLGRIPGGSLEVFRAVEEHGWIGGQQWEADSSPIPFILSTRNGGKRWTDRYLWKEDDRNGMVLEFDFENLRHGFLIIERTNTDVDPFELYENDDWGQFVEYSRDDERGTDDPIRPGSGGRHVASCARKPLAAPTGWKRERATTGSPLRRLLRRSAPATTWNARMSCDLFR